MISVNDMNVIFLDIDGVLNSEVSARKFQTCYRLDPDAMAHMNRIIKETGAVVVLSSTWRRYHDKGNMELILMQTGFPQNKLIDYTPVLEWSPQTNRGTEIKTWLEAHPDVERFVILDDDCDMGELMPFLIHVNGHCGLTGDDASRAIALVNKSRNENTEENPYSEVIKAHKKAVAEWPQWMRDCFLQNHNANL